MFSTNRVRHSAKSGSRRRSAEPPPRGSRLMQDRASFLTLSVYTISVVGLLGLLASYQS
jgi:hypothetical protein